MKLLAMALLLVPSIAFAQVKQVPQKKTFIDFSGGVLWEGFDRPSDSYVLAPPRTKFGSLIKLRANFNPELTKSVDALR